MKQLLNTYYTNKPQVIRDVVKLSYCGNRIDLLLLDFYSLITYIIYCSFIFFDNKIDINSTIHELFIFSY